MNAGSSTAEKSSRSSISGSGAGKAAQNERALRELGALCDTLGVGARLPLHTELMARFGVSERAILRAFTELQRTGRLVRKPGLGTLVAELAPDPAADAAAEITPPRTLIAVARVDHSFFDYCLDLLCAYADDSGDDFTVLCKPLRSGEEATPESLGALAARPAGQRFVLFGYHLAPVARYLRERGAHVVLVGTPPAGVTPDVPCVYGDQEYGGYLVTRHLIALGHRRIAFLHDESLPRMLRWRGFRRAVGEAGRRGLEIDARHEVVSLDAWESDPAQVTEFLRRPDAPTALLLWNDREALRLLPLLQRAGVRVPEDVSVAGYDDLPAALHAFPALTTADPAVSHQLRAAVDLLTRAGDGAAPAAPTATVVVPALLARDSTSAPPGTSTGA
ncbi:MAG TPA: substrate-binding domain-containing protein [Armatimonadaceae bacterium]|nr:substrate-binding domain-containing protein [Armatimonadaceae bacterium]